MVEFKGFLRLPETTEMLIVVRKVSVSVVSVS